MKTLSMAILLASVGLLCAAPATADPRVGEPAPALVGETLQGQPFDLRKLRGHTVVVNLWATWCPPCRAEMPMLDAFYKAHQADGVALVGLSADRHRDIRDVRKVMGSFSYPAVVLSDAKLNGFGSPRALPITYVIDSGGIVRAILSPGDKPLAEAQLNAAVSQASAVKP